VRHRTSKNDEQLRHVAKADAELAAEHGWSQVPSTLHMLVWHGAFLRFEIADELPRAIQARIIRDMRAELKRMVADGRL
jgi:hypothetical protein